MDKVLKLAREAGIDWLIANYDMEPQLHAFYTLARADYETKLSAVMPADFKDWHENNRSEWPDIAAWVITNLREQRADLEAENAALLAANLDCIDHFNQLKVDFDDVQADNAKLREVLERVYVTCDWHGDDGRDAMQAARAALGEK